MENPDKLKLIFNKKVKTYFPTQLSISSLDFNDHEVNLR